MPDNRERLTSLNSAAGLYVLCRSLGSHGTASIVWALICFAIAGLLLANAGANIAALVFCAIAAALLAEGIYVLRSRSRAALTCQAVTLAFLAAWDLAAFGYSLHLHSTGTAHGHPPNPLLGLIIAYNAWKAWSARTEFTKLSDSSTEADVERAEFVIKRALSSSPKTTPNMVQLKQIGLSVRDPQWRIWFDPDFAYLIQIHTFFSSKLRPVTATVCNRNSLSFEVTGETWIGNSQKLKLIVDGIATHAAYEMSPEMLEKLSMMTGMPVASTLR
jgi:hypothetical protein